MEILKIEIISGEIVPGERLLSVRDLAIKLKANPNTVQRALGELESEGLIFTERTNGKYVTNDTALILNCKSDYAQCLAKTYLDNMAKIGFSKTEATNQIKNFGGN